MISHRKYAHLSKFDAALTDKDRADMKEYEEAKRPKPTKKSIEYFKKVISNPVDNVNFKVKYEVLKTKFLIKFKEVEGVEFDMKNFSNVEPILYYFARDERFYSCNNVNKISVPSLDKGLLIIGNYGNGKTSTMRVLKHLFNNTPLSFKMYTANTVVSTFEGQADSAERHSFMSRTKTATAYFDDVKSEKIASNFGKFNLFKDIIEERYIRKLKTYITCNYREEDISGDVDSALMEFSDKYGARVYDRLFEMFNVIEFNGKSMRR